MCSASCDAAVILIGHDMGLMAQFVDKVAVMYAGRLVELSTVARHVHSSRCTPTPQALITSLPNLDNKGVFQGIPGLAPSLLRLPGGCAFHPRCGHAMDVCRIDAPRGRDARRTAARRLPLVRRGGADDGRPCSNSQTSPRSTRAA